MTTEVELRSVRLAIYEGIVERGVAPSTHDIAEACAMPEPRVRSVVRGRADAHLNQSPPA